ncbi:MAG: peptide deformylase [Thermaerobacter sp.]|nr:peptide deformylase [Thermaerobacter sp.]
MQIRIAGDEVLRLLAKPVKRVNRQVRELLDEMAQSMYAASGIGLAAPQVGVSRRLLVADVGTGLVELVNPQILYREGMQVGLEGCLSIPDLVGEVERAERIRVTAQNRVGHQMWIEADGLLARCLQHEIDHLDGILFTDIAIKVMPASAVQETAQVVLD